VAGLLIVESAAAQSLADIARKEAERRKAVPQASKAYTNEDLRRVAPMSESSQPPEGPKAPAALPPSPPVADAAKAAPVQPKVEEPPRDEASWRKRITDARADLERTTLLIEALENRVNSLSADFAARDDPAQRTLISRDRQKAIAELERMKVERDTQAKAIKAVEEEARQAGVPPGWLR
jgi:hypothetical protein